MAPLRLLADGLTATSTSTDVARVLGAHAAGRTAFVTGASSGLGFEVARTLLACGAHIIAAALPAEADDALVTRLRAAAAIVDVAQAERASHAQPPEVQVLPIDLGDLVSVRAAAARVVATGRPVHLLVNNAGVMAVALGASQQGFERHWAINYLGHWELVRALQPALRAGAPARVVNVASAAHALLSSPEGLDWDRLGAPAASLQRSYDPWQAYATSKLALVLHAAELTRREEEAGITAAAVHPGAVHGTQLGARLSLGVAARLAVAPRIWEFILFGPRPVTKSVEQGAATILAAALAPTLPQPGGYYSDCAAVPPTDRFLTPLAADPTATARLWDATTELVDRALASAAQSVEVSLAETAVAPAVLSASSAPTTSAVAS